MSRNDKVFCFEPPDVNSPLVTAAERLYLATQHPDERIPWGWIARSIKGRATWRPGCRGSHLLVATASEDPDAAELAGFSYGLHMPGFGGYLCYVGVAEGFRRRGVGTRLFDQTFKVLAADAGAADESFPFLIWESHKPAADAPEADWKLWDARVRLFDRAGGLWAGRGRVAQPDYGTASASPVPLCLFLRPADHLARNFDADRLRGVVASCSPGCTSSHPATRCTTGRCRRGAGRGCGRPATPGRKKARLAAV